MQRPLQWSSVQWRHVLLQPTVLVTLYSAGALLKRCLLQLRFTVIRLLTGCALGPGAQQDTLSTTLMPTTFLLLFRSKWSLGARSVADAWREVWGCDRNQRGPRGRWTCAHAEASHLHSPHTAVHLWISNCLGATRLSETYFLRSRDLAPDNANIYLETTLVYRVLLYSLKPGESITA